MERYHYASPLHFSSDDVTWLALQHRFERGVRDGFISDIYDGVGYKRHIQFLSHPSNVSLILNTDGVALFRSSGY